jgi:TonB-linked SusC/RagA family outer membrane protein
MLSPARLSIALISHNNSQSTNQNQFMKLKNLLTTCFLILLCFYIKPAMAQSKTVNGRVTDSHDGTLLPGVSVAVKGTQTGTITSANGNFKLAVPDGATTLVFTFVGYNRLEVPVTTGAPINVQLQASATDLNEVVVVGYGTRAKKDVTGAVESISSKDFNQGAIINPLSQIQGKVAGLVITQQSGDPNDQGASISIRGQTSITGDQSPLVVIDGVATLASSSQFQNLSPNDIASYDVLKDASATAIYGSRGANGVIVVTTKKGHAGRTTIDYDGYVGMATQAKYWNLLNASQYIQALTDINNADAAAGKPGINLATYEQGANTNWQKAVSRTAVVQSNNLSIAGGSKGFTYRGSLNYENQQGIILNTNKQQYGMRFNGEEKALNDKLDITLNISSTTVNRDQLTDGNVYTYYIFNAPPTYPIYKNGTYNAFTDFDLANPIEHLKEITNTQTSWQTLSNATVDYSLLPNLKIGGLGAIIHDNTSTDYFYPTFPNEGNINNASRNFYDVNTYEANAHINYNQTFGKHNLAATVVYEYNDFRTDGFGAGGQDYLVPAELDNNLGAGDPTKNGISSYRTDYKIVSLLARINYNYDERFYLTASVRRDGSDLFGTNHEFGTFPSFDLAYRMKKDLLKNVDWVNDLKLRVGYGVVGNSNGINPYETYTLFNAGSRYYDGSNQSYLYPNSYSYSQNPNPDLQWEERIGRNIGVDFSLFNYRLTGDINYYSDKTKNMLYNYGVPTPPFIYGSIEANVGSMTNKGLEIALTGKALTGSGFNWTINGQITFVKTRVVSLSGTYDGYPVLSNNIVTGSAAGRGLSNTNLTYLIQGDPLNMYYIPHYTGVDANGNEEFDGKTLAQWSAAGQAVPLHYIDPNPKFTYGIGNTFSYKNWSFTFFLRGVYGDKIFNNVLLDFQTTTRLPGANTTVAALNSPIKDGLQISDHWLQPGSFLRLDNASLGYTFKNIKGISNLRLFLAGNNLFVITRYQGLDPEITGTYIDQNTYPKARTITLGASVSFQ